ncbi:hypothetical protein CIY_14670 [Butyrivibrio fibrisolvens 16/4]|nr:hypothetical protein CIY_14670 [Butyrivibrio fibrisolvens 16/4]
MPFYNGIGTGLFTVMFNYKTASLYTSKIFSFVVAAVLTIFEIGSFTHAGAEELLYFIFTLTVYHVARQLKYGFLSYHTYLLAIDFALVFSFNRAIHLYGLL